MTRATLEPGDDLAALAETRIRKLANRHGHTRTAGPSGRPVERCPDRTAHRSDVADMTTVLQAVGLAPYASGVRPKASRNFGQKRQRR